MLLIVSVDQFWVISAHFFWANYHYLGWVITLGSTHWVFGILRQIHQKNLGRGQTPPFFGNARILRAFLQLTPPLKSLIISITHDVASNKSLCDARIDHNFSIDWQGVQLQSNGRGGRNENMSDEWQNKKENHHLSLSCYGRCETKVTCRHVFVAPRKQWILSLAINGIRFFEQSNFWWFFHFY